MWSAWRLTCFQGKYVEICHLSSPSSVLSQLTRACFRNISQMQHGKWNQNDVFTAEQMLSSQVWLCNMRDFEANAEWGVCKPHISVEDRLINLLTCTVFVFDKQLSDMGQVVTIKKCQVLIWWKAHQTICGKHAPGITPILAVVAVERVATKAASSTSRAQSRNVLNLGCWGHLFFWLSLTWVWMRERESVWENRKMRAFEKYFKFDIMNGVEVGFAMLVM